MATPILITPNIKLRKKQLNLNGENWGKFRNNCYEFLAILKAWQYRQSNGLGWFTIDENTLDNNIYLINWRHYLGEMIKANKVLINPLNNMLDFKDNGTMHFPIEHSNKIRFKELKRFLLKTDSNRYNKIYRGGLGIQQNKKL